jgi:hypothetical protein
MSEAQPQQNVSPLKVAVAIPGGILGWVVGNYAGFNLVIPVVLALIIGLIASRVVNEQSRTMLPAFALQAGHMLWMLLEILYAGAFHPAILHVIIVAIGLGWLIARPGLLPVILLSLFQTLAFLINFNWFLSAPVGSVQHKALVVHLLFRVLAIILMWHGLYRLRKVTEAESTMPVLQPEEYEG